MKFEALKTEQLKDNEFSDKKIGARRNFLKGMIVGAGLLATGEILKKESFAEDIISAEDESDDSFDIVKSLNERIDLFTKRKMELEEEMSSCTDDKLKKRYVSEIKSYEDVIESTRKEIYLIENPSEIQEVDTENVKVRIVYEFHKLEHRKEVLKNLDAYFMEGITLKKNDVSSIKFGEHAYEGMDDEVLNELKITGKPIYQCDVNGEYLAGKTIKEAAGEAKKEKLLFLAGLSAGGFFSVKFARDLVRLVKNLKKEKKEGEAKSENISRRKFLGVFGKSMAAILVADTAIQATQGNKILDQNSPYSKYFKKRQKIMGVFSSRLVGLTLRNAIMAQKICTTSKMMKEKSGNKPHVGLEIGAAHFGVEDFLRMPEQERIEIIEGLIKEGNLEIKDPENDLALIVREVFNKDKNKWEETRFVDQKIMDIFKS